MSKPVRSTKKVVGLPPGTLVHVGETRSERVKISVIDYTPERLNECEAEHTEDCVPFKESDSVTWINVSGVHQVELVEQLGAQFGLHPLTLEDIVNTRLRPKLEDFDTYLFAVLKMPYYDNGRETVRAEQVSLIIMDRCVISFQQWEGDVFEPIRARLRASRGRIRAEGADYLAYALVDAIVDNCFAILETLGDRIEDAQESLVSKADTVSLKAVHDLKREMILLRKAMWPLREVISGLARGDSSLIRETTGVYLRNVYDHTVQVLDTIESLRDMVSGMVDLYLSSVSNKMNEVMKVLTIIATIFIPLTFIAGIYGMNFAHMPELKWQWSYPLVWLIMACIAVVMLFYFRRKQWL